MWFLHYKVKFNFKTWGNCVKYTQDAYINPRVGQSSGVSVDQQDVEPNEKIHEQNILAQSTLQHFIILS